MRAVFHHPSGSWLRDRIEVLADGLVDIDFVAEATGPNLDKVLARADILLHVLHPVTATLIASAPNLKLIQKLGVGLDSIDLDAAGARGIAVCNMPGTNTQAVAELTLGLMLSVLRGIPDLDRQLRAEGNWELSADAQGRFGEIAGKVVGLVGYGHVARRLETILTVFGADVLIVSRSPVKPQTARQVTKETLLARADIVSLHIPEAPETRHWLDAAALAALRPGAIVINTARGSLIDEAALVAALSSGHIAGAGLDVYAREPVERGSDILNAPNVVALPHVAWLTRETLDRSLRRAVENIERLREGRTLRNRQI